MDRTTLYAGPGKVYMGSTALFPTGENGQIKLDLNQETDEVASALHGHIDETSADVQLRVSVTPFDNWGNLGLLFPASVLTPAVGTRFPGGSDVVAKVWRQTGELYTLQSAWVSKHPELHLGVGVPLFGDCQLTGVIKNNAEVGSATAFLAVATAQADPGGNFTLADFIREAWVGVWGAVTGFGAIQAEDEWVISVSAKYSPLKVQKLTRAYKLDGVAVMAKCRPVGPTHAQILTNAAVQDSPGALGRRLGSGGSTLTLTGSQSGKTITITNAALKTAGYEFGGTKLGTGEIGFVTGLTFTTGAPNALIAFSA